MISLRVVGIIECWNCKQAIPVDEIFDTSWVFKLKKCELCEKMNKIRVDVEQ